MPNAIFFASRVLIDGKIEENCFIHVKDGIIADISKNTPEEPVISLDGLVIPGLVNGHSHAFQVLLRGRNEHPRDFHDWVNSALYPLVMQLSPEDIEIATMVAYAQMLRNGITTVGEFHYIHNKPDGSYYEDKDTISKRVIDAALVVGIRQRFLYCGYDLGTKPAQKRFHRTAEEVINSVEALREMYRSSARVSIGVAPHSLHGASEEMIIELVDWARQQKEIAHIHVAEQRSDLTLSQEKYGLSPIRYLHSKGLLNEYLSVVHSIWVDEEEIAMLKQANSAHVYNPLTNMALGDGIAPMVKYAQAGVKTNVGTDANIRLDLFREVRAVEWLQRVTQLEMGIIARSITAEKTPSHYLLDMATTNGQYSLNLPIGRIAKGYYADFVVVDVHDFSIRKHGDLVDQLISSLDTSLLVKQVFVHGDLVYERDHGFLRFNENELLDKFQAIQ